MNIEYFINKLRNSLTKEVIKVNDDERNAFNQVLKYINELESQLLDANKLTEKLILQFIMDEVCLRKLNSKEAIRKMESMMDCPLEAFYENIEKKQPDIAFDNIWQREINNNPILNEKEAIDVSRKKLVNALKKDYSPIKEKLKEVVLKLIIKLNF